MIRDRKTVTERELSLAEQAYDQIRRMILERELPGGMSVVENRMVDHLEISRTPIREALMRLAAEGLLVKRGSRSFAVRGVSAAEFFQSIRIREILECEAITLAHNKIDKDRILALRRSVVELGKYPEQTAAHWKLDDQLHQMFANASGNIVLSRTITDLRTSTRLCEVTNPLGRVPASTAEHLALLDAFLDEDVESAKTAMLNHLRNVASDCVATLRGM
nr:GntR family transcriptional regulator [Komagataeibacter melomenusus]